MHEQMPLHIIVELKTKTTIICIFKEVLPILRLDHSNKLKNK